MPLTPEEARARKRASMLKWRAANPEKFRESMIKSRAKAYAANPDKFRARSRKDYTDNRDRALQTRHKYVAENPDKAYAATRRAHLKRCAENPTEMRAKAVAYTQAYQASKLKACPPWADRSHLEFIYANCPDGYEVDHIIPLRGKGFGGLHVPANLQYLPARVNRSKGNRCVDVSTSAIVPPPWTHKQSMESITCAIQSHLA